MVEKQHSVKVALFLSYPWHVCTLVLCTPWRHGRHISCMVMVLNYACLFQQRHDDCDLFKCAQ